MVVMVVQFAEVGRVPPRTLAGWVVDASYHVVITEKGVPPGALGDIRYPSEYPGAVPFPTEVAVGEAWEGWVDGLNIGDAAGDFAWYLSSTSACLGDLAQLPPVNIPAGHYQALQLTGTGPADFWICLMRYVP